MSGARNLNNGEYARVIGILNVLVAREASKLAQGMWNPHFVAADADTTALVAIGELMDAVDQGFFRASLPTR